MDNREEELLELAITTLSADYAAGGDDAMVRWFETTDRAIIYKIFMQVFPLRLLMEPPIESEQPYWYHGSHDTLPVWPPKVVKP